MESLEKSLEMFGSTSDTKASQDDKEEGEEKKYGEEGIERLEAKLRELEGRFRG